LTIPLLVQASKACKAARFRNIGVFRVNPLTFKKYSEFIYKLSGINLPPEKNALVEARIAKRMRQLGINDHKTYLKYVTSSENNEEPTVLIDAISTNVTNFFREPDHFVHIGNILSQQLKKGQKKFRFWSAACSSGEEPYSLAVTLLEAAQARDLDLKILATDISTEILKKAHRGLYAEKDVAPVPKTLLSKYFFTRKADRGKMYKVKTEVRRLVVFKRLNLSTPPFPMSGPFDAVLCRNVMIYFDNSVRQKLLDDVCRLLRPGGLLIVGHTESLSGIKLNVKTIVPSVYRKII